MPRMKPPHPPRPAMRPPGLADHQDYNPNFLEEYKKWVAAGNPKQPETREEYAIRMGHIPKEGEDLFD